MKKYLLFIAAALLYACTENTLEPISNEVNVEPANLSSKENSVSINQASTVAGMFMASYVQGKSTTTRNVIASGNPDELLNKTVQSIKTIHGEDKTPSMYIINYERGGFVIVSATKTYYPILGYSDTGSFNIEEAMQSGFSIWADETNQAIEESDMQNAETLAMMSSMWAFYEESSTPATTRDDTSDHYRDETMFRQRLGELYALCPGYSFGPLSSASHYFSQSEYQSLVEKADIYGSPLNVTIVGYKESNRLAGPLLNTRWGQKKGYNALCPNDSPAGCVAIAMAQIMKYYEWPQHFDWNDMADDSPTFASQTLISTLGKAVQMNYGAEESGATIGHTKIGFEIMGYTVSKKDHSKADVESEIFFKGRPVFMTGDKKNFIGITWKGHAWVCDGVQQNRSSGSYFVEYLVNRSTNPSYSSCGFPSYSAPFTSSGFGITFFHMNWGWHGDNDGWFNGDNVHPTDDKNYQYGRENLYVSPQK